MCTWTNPKQTWSAIPYCDSNTLNLNLDTPKVKQRHQEARLRAQLDQEQAVPPLPSSLRFRPRQGLKK